MFRCDLELMLSQYCPCDSHCVLFTRSVFCHMLRGYVHQGENAIILNNLGYYLKYCHVKSKVIFI